MGSFPSIFLHLMHIPQLPSDIILYYLVWYIETRGRCKLFCKRWNEATHKPNFIQLFNQRRTISRLFVQSLKWSKYRFAFVSVDNSSNRGSQLSLNFLPRGKVKIEPVSKHGGLILCINYHSNYLKPWVCKPITRQWIQIPNPKTHFLSRKDLIGQAIMCSILSRGNDFHEMRFALL